MVVIPAIKKNAVIPDQLIKKLDGVTLIQRAIDTATGLVSKKDIFVITDSIEISLICERNGIGFHKDPKLFIDSENIFEIVAECTNGLPQENILVYRANTPLVNIDILKDAYASFLTDTSACLISVGLILKKVFELQDNKLKNLDLPLCYEELKAFLIFSKTTTDIRALRPYVIDIQKSTEIDGYQNWWVCEKILQRKKIVFNVIGDTKIGMGHIYHSLALAHEIIDHEVVFVCQDRYEIAVFTITAKDYMVISTPDVLQTIMELRPDLVINDTLDTEFAFVQALKEQNVKVVNFEDLGGGSKIADLVFNELYDEPQIAGEHYLWGYNYVALRDEFDDALPHEFCENVSEILITFGGTDQNNLTLKSLSAIYDICKIRSIKINIVCGGGYLFKRELEEYLAGLEYQNIDLTFASGVISKIMEKTQLAISSNGRTVYELADMNIPAIVVSHHDREATHTFASLEHGFINLGVVNEQTTAKISEKFEKLVTDVDYRELLFMNIKRYSFRQNKKKVVQKILSLIEN